MIIVFGTVKKQTKCDKTFNVTNIDIPLDDEVVFQNGANKGFSDYKSVMTIISMTYLLTSDK